MREGRVAVERGCWGRPKGWLFILCRDIPTLLKAGQGSEAEIPARDGRNFQQLKSKALGLSNTKELP